MGAGRGQPGSLQKLGRGFHRPWSYWGPLHTLPTRCLLKLGLGLLGLTLPRSLSSSHHLNPNTWNSPLPCKVCHRAGRENRCTEVWSGNTVRGEG